MPLSRPQFIHCYTQTSASLGRSLLRPKEIVAHAVQQQTPAIALTDSNNLFLAMRFGIAAREQGIQPIHGARVTVNVNSFIPEENTTTKFTSLHPAKASQSIDLGLIVKNSAGWTSLSQLLTRGWINSKKNNHFILNWQEIQAHSEGLILLTGGSDGLFGALLSSSNFNHKSVSTTLQAIAKKFANNCYVEIMRQPLASTLRADNADPPEIATNAIELEQAQIELANKLGLPILATHRCAFTNAEDQAAHEVLQCIHQQYRLSDDKRPRSTADWRIVNQDTMLAQFADIPQACLNSVDLAQRISFALNKADKIYMPQFPKLGGLTAIEKLRQNAQAGLQHHLINEVLVNSDDSQEHKAITEKYQQRLEAEIRDIATVGYEGYFLIVADFIDFAEQNDIPVGIGRGSAAGSIVAWCLGITGIDPIKYDLLFERFINPDRLTPPDIDIDFCGDRRDQVINYVQQQYGERNVAHIITFGRMQSRAVIRDVGRVLSIPYLEVDTIAKLIPENALIAKISITEILDPKSEHHVPELKRQLKDNYHIEQLLTLAVRLEGLFRNASMHAAGIVIGEKPLDTSIPLYCDPAGKMLITQFDMDDVALAGMLKFDFLGLTTLSIIQRTKHFLQQRNITIDLARIDYQDSQTFAMLNQDLVLGIFQMESHGMRRVLQALRPDCVEDIIALVALFRPGPMQNIPSYIARKHGKEKIEYPHPLLATVLQETYGIAVYQEQVMRIAQVMAGFSLQRADSLRVAMAKKITEKINSLHDPFILGAEQNGIPGKLAQQIFTQLSDFANYGFNKSHAAAYGITSYQTAYLKCHYPGEFIAATMDYAINDIHRLNLLVNECNRIGISVNPPDINYSAATFAVTDNGKVIRYALSALKNIGKNICHEIVSERNTHGKFASIEDFFKRVPINVIKLRQMEVLVNAGCFDQLQPDRELLSLFLPKLIALAQQFARQRESKQLSLFSAQDELPWPQLVYPEGLKPKSNSTTGTFTAPVVAQNKLSEQEFSALGFYLCHHPFSELQHLLKQEKVVSAQQVFRLQHGPESKKLANNFNMAGIGVKARKMGATNHDRSTYFLTCSDQTGVFEIVAYTEAWGAEAQHMFQNQTPMLLSVTCRSNSGDRNNLRITLIAPPRSLIESSYANTTVEIAARIDDFDPKAFRNLLTAYKKNGDKKIRINLITKDGTNLRLTNEREKYKIDEALFAALGKLPGIVTVTYTQQ